ncbi:hypothetical protein BJ170DRAFT_275852 [Xylariales sp. AK1849]|nr:hypothetical protein BJ170DRAFT_275852 [Xylariales sp. AK1849]
MNAWFNNPTWEGGESTPESIQMWRNLNSFAARCMGAGVLGLYVKLMDALRETLEEELGIDQDPAKAECNIEVACEWIARCAKLLIWWAQENIGYVDTTEDSTQNLPGGPLYQGPHIVCLRRWEFWQTWYGLKVL